MITPRNGVTIKQTTNSVRFTWNEIDPQKQYILQLMTSSKNAKPVSVPVKGNTHVVNFKSLPDTLYWRVYAKNDETGKSVEPFKVHFYKKTKIEFAADVGFVKTNAKLKANNLSETENLSGPMIEVKAFYSPRNWKKLITGFFLRSMQLSNGKAKLDEMRMAAEAGWKLQSNFNQSQTVYLHYQFGNRQKYTFKDSSTATYDVAFIGARYNFTRRLNEWWNSSLDALLLSPTQFNVRPSFTIRPQIGRRLNSQWRADAFVQLEDYYSKPKDNDFGNVTVELQNLSIGAGVTYQY